MVGLFKTFPLLGITALLTLLSNLSVNAISATSDSLLLSQRSFTESAATVRQAFQPIPLSEIQRQHGGSLTGENPTMLTIQAFEFFKPASESDAEQIEVRYPQPGKAVVMLTRLGLTDDSVIAVKYRVELEAMRSPSAKPQWQIVWAGRQFKCQPRRGQQDWAAALCQ